jgi:hypothetical protein
LPGNPQNTPHRTDSSSAIHTGGQVFDDGNVLELVEDLTQANGLGLLAWNGRKAVMSPRVVHKNQAYVPLALHPSVRRALRLPSGVSPITSTATLFSEVGTVIAKFTDLAEPCCRQLAAFVFASWMADRLPAPFNLSLWSPVATDGARVLRLLSCLCRQALPLSGTSARDLCLLPTELQATLLIFRPASGRRTRELLAACGWRGFHAARSGQFGEFLGSVALSTDAPLNDRSLDPLLEIAIAPAKRPLPVLDKPVQLELAKEFQPKLLRYRLLHLASVAGTGSAEAATAGPAGQLATGLCILFADEPTLRAQELAMLIEAEPNGTHARLTDPRVLLIEVLWSRCHEDGVEQLYVAEIAADMNAVFSVSGGVDLSARMTGSLMKSLGLLTFKLDRKGRGVELDRPTRTLIHHLARVYEVPSAGAPFARCPECSPAQDTGS